MNPMQMMLAFKNPQAFIQKMMSSPQVVGNTLAQNILKMAQSGDIRGIEELGRNIARERGQNFDKEFAEFKSQFPTQ